MSVVNQEVEKLINIGFTYHQDGCLDEAENAYQEVLTIDGKNAEVFNLLGVLKLQQNDVISAINWIEKAVEIKPDVYFQQLTGLKKLLKLNLMFIFMKLFFRLM